jgi:membrane-bound metal-dependent hydrolase YbcI (DUF457 family)
MDSLTQFVLGAAVGHLILSRHIGVGKAMLIGGLSGTIPDLDMIPLSFTDMVTQLDLHRSLSHSILFCLIAPLGFTKIAQIFTQRKISFWRWYALWFLGFFTHILIDACTTWGTQIFWPLPYRVSFNSVFIIDPLYTLPLIVSLVTALYVSRKSISKDVFLASGEKKRVERADALSIPSEPDTEDIYKTKIVDSFARTCALTVSPESSIPTKQYSPDGAKKWQVSQRIVAIGILISSSYLLWGIGVKHYINHQFETALATQNIAITRYMTRPTPFNSFLWAITAETETGYISGYRSVFDSSEIQFSAPLDKAHDHLTPYHHNPKLQTLLSITNGYYRVEKIGSVFAIHDMRFGDFGGWNGTPGDDIFTYLYNPETKTFEQTRPQVSNPKIVLKGLWHRVWGI